MSDLLAEGPGVLGVQVHARKPSKVEQRTRCRVCGCRCRILSYNAKLIKRERNESTEAVGKGRGRTVFKVNHDADDELVVAHEGSRTAFAQLARLERMMILSLNLVAQLEYSNTGISFSWTRTTSFA